MNSVIVLPASWIAFEAPLVSTQLEKITHFCPSSSLEEDMEAGISVSLSESDPQRVSLFTDSKWSFRSKTAL
jgi:hypothetical protein